MEDDKDLLWKKYRHYQDVSESLGKEIEYIAKSKKEDSELLTGEDIELLMMAKEFFNEFLEDFQDNVTPEEKEKMLRLNSLIDKIIDLYGKNRYNNLYKKE